MYKTSRLISNRLLLATALLTVVVSPLIAYSQNNARTTSQPGVKTDKRAYPEPPPPALPAAGGKFQDPVFGTTIMRVTDENDGSFNVTAYSYYPTFNVNSTRLVILGTGGAGMLYQLDPVNFRVSGKRRLFTAAMPGGGYPGSEDAIWSGTDPDVIYCHAYLKIYAYNVVTNQYTLIKDFAGQLPGSEITQLSKSIDDNVFAFHLKDASYKVIGYAAWQRSQNNLYRVDTSDVNEVQLDKTGQYLYVITETSGPATAIEGRVVNLQTRQVTDLTDGPPDYAPGHKDMGRGFVVGYENWANRFLYRSLASPHQFRTVIDFGSDWSMSNHASQLADDDNWILISTYVANGLPSTNLFRNELFQASTDGTQRVRRLAHMHSVYREYWDTPRASMSKDGRFAAFTSNWGSTSRRDVFVVLVPGASGGGGGGGDTTAPVISSIASTNITSSGASVNWTTNEASDTQVEYGTTTGYGSGTQLNALMTTSHSAVLSGLSGGTLYHYRVKSKDAAGNLATSGDLTFTTAAGGGGGGGTVITDKNVYPEPPPPALPAAGGKFQDPVFGTTIMRVTDENDGSFNVTAYSYYPTFNVNSTRLVILGTGGAGMLYQLDPVNFRVSGKRRLFTAAMPGGGYPGSEDAIWSGTDPDVIYCHAYLKIYAYNVVTNQYTLIKDFAGQLPGSEIWQLSKSIDDNVFGFHLKDSSYRVVGYAAWQRSQNNLYRVDTSDVNEVQLDKTGQYLYVITETSGPATAIEGRVVNLQTRQVTDLTDGPPDYAPGHKDMGRGYVVGYENWKNSFLYRPLATPHKFHTVLSFGNDWSIGNHVSLLSDDESWILLGTFVANDLPSQKVFRNELLLVSTDGTQRVRRLAHMHSVYREYWDTPRATISRDGRFAAFTSNWGSATRRDVFVVLVPTPNSGESASRTDASPVAPVANRPATTGNDSALRHNVTWASLVRCAATGSSLQKTAGRDDAADAGATSEQSIASGEGFVEFTAAETNKTRYCGLARNSQGTDFAGIDFAIKLTATGVAEVRENGAYAGEVKYQGNDLFRIAIEGGQVKYYKNGELFYTSLNEPVYPLVVKASFVNFNSRINNVVISQEPRAKD